MADVGHRNPLNSTDLIMKGVHFDDQVWYQAMLVERFNDARFQRVRESPQTANRFDTALHHLLDMGIHDFKPIDKPWDASTRSMRYSAALSNCLMEMIIQQRERVRSFWCFTLID